FEPIFLPKETAHLITATTELNVECIAVGALPEREKDFGALTGGEWTREQENTDLELPSNELAQLRMRIVDDLQIEFSNPSPTKQWRTSKAIFYLPQFPTTSAEDFMKQYYFKASEFHVWEKDTPRFDLYAPNGDLATSRIIFNGWRFRVKKIDTPGKITIWVSGWPSGVAS
ncbi:unnamed protein product, partial [marine sediment metagenome]